MNLNTILVRDLRRQGYSRRMVAYLIALWRKERRAIRLLTKQSPV